MPCGNWDRRYCCRSGPRCPRCQAMRAIGHGLASARREMPEPVRRAHPEENGSENRFLFSQRVKQRQRCRVDRSARSNRGAWSQRPTHSRNRRIAAPEKAHLEPTRGATAAVASPIRQRDAIPLTTARSHRHGIQRISTRPSWEAKTRVFARPRKHSPSVVKPSPAGCALIRLPAYDGTPTHPTRPLPKKLTSSNRAR